MQKRQSSLLILALVTMAAMALAQAEDPKADVQTMQVGTEQPAPDVVVMPQLTPEEQELHAIKDAGRAAVAALAAQLESQATEQGRADLQKQIEAAKVNSQVEMLHKIIEFALAKGDQLQVEEARRILDITLNGPQVQPQSVHRPAPIQDQGGQR
jgi:Xaa-Pro aminopeptidase